MLDDRRDGAGAAADHRQPGGPGLDEREAERLVAGRRREHVERREHVALARLVEVEQEAHAVAGGGREQADGLLDRREERRRRPGDEQEGVGLVLPDEAHRCHEVVDALVAAELADEADQRDVGGHADLLRAARAPSPPSTVAASTPGGITWIRSGAMPMRST